MDKFKQLRIWVKHTYSKNKKGFSKINYGLFILFTFIVLFTISHPNHVLNETVENNITQATNFVYKADILPYTLNTTGGISDIDKTIFTKITKDIIVNVKSGINADKEITVVGTRKLVMKLIAEELWEKEYVLSPEENFELVGTDNLIFHEDYNLNLKELQNLIEQVGKEISTSPSSYRIEIIPIISGTIAFQDQVIPISINANSSFDYSETIIRLNEENEISQSMPVMNTTVTPQVLQLAGMKLPMGMVKLIIGLLYFSLLIFIGYKFYYYLKYCRPIPSKEQQIDKKYKNRFINVMNELNTSTYEKIELDSFLALVKISDEKDSLILRYDGSKTVSYYLIDARYVYIYQIIKENDKAVELFQTAN